MKSKKCVCLLKLSKTQREAAVVVGVIYLAISFFIFLPIGVIDAKVRTYSQYISLEWDPVTDKPVPGTGTSKVTTTVDCETPSMRIVRAFPAYRLGCWLGEVPK